MKKMMTAVGIALIPFSVFAAEKPSMSALWLELLFLTVLLIVLKLAKFSNQQKFILFISYILSGIITKTIWFPVLLFVIMFFIFSKNTDDDGLI